MASAYLVALNMRTLMLTILTVIYTIRVLPQNMPTVQITRTVIITHMAQVDASALVSILQSIINGECSLVYFGHPY